MSVLLGALLGAGVLLVWWSFWPSAPRGKKRARSWLTENLNQAGIDRVKPAQVIASCIGVGVFLFLLVYLISRSLPIALCFLIFGSWLPITLIRYRARKRQAVLRDLWPDVVDHLRSAIRAGMSLPESLAQLGDKGPEELRPVFQDFAADYRSTGNFDLTLNRLKVRLSDPVADRIIEALRLAREVGGTDLGKLLGTLGDFLRETTRTRRELEARQSWTVNAARLAVAAPWIVLLLLSTQPQAVRAYNSPAGVAILLGGLLVSFICYRLMLRIGALPEETRVLK